MVPTIRQRMAVRVRAHKDGRETVTERAEASSVESADRSEPLRSLFLREGRTMGLRPKGLWPPERRAVRVMRVTSAGRQRVGAAQDERRCHSGHQIAR